MKDEHLPVLTFYEYQALACRPHPDYIHSGQYAMELLRRVCPMLYNEVTICKPELDTWNDVLKLPKTLAYLSIHWPEES